MLRVRSAQLTIFLGPLGEFDPGATFGDIENVADDGQPRGTGRESRLGAFARQGVQDRDGYDRSEDRSRSGRQVRHTRHGGGQRGFSRVEEVRLLLQSRHPCRLAERRLLYLLMQRRRGIVGSSLGDERELAGDKSFSRSPLRSSRSGHVGGLKICFRASKCSGRGFRTLGPEADR